MLLDRLKIKLKQDKGLGLVPDRKDERDFELGVFNIGDYKPKAKRKILQTLGVKNQGEQNTCTQESATLQKEIQEGEPLSERSLTVFMKKLGYISGNGFSSLRKSQKAIQKYGIAAMKKVDNKDYYWSKYSSENIITKEVLDSAEQNRIKSFWSVKTIDEVLKCIDDGLAVQMACWWRTAYNRAGGFSSPWILPFGRGSKVGGHAITAIGYDLNYEGERVIVMQNSFGVNWGDSGKFYVKFKDAQKMLSIFTGKVQLDMPVEVGKFLRDYNQMNVKSESSPKIYKIENGKKRHFKTWKAFIENGGESGFEIVDDDTLKAIKKGKDIK